MADVKEVTIVVDKGESRSGVDHYLAGQEGVTLTTADLLSGDYAFADIGVERKSANDLILSIMDRRIFSQVELLVSEYKTAIVLIEGDLRSVRSAFDPGALDGAISWLALLSGVQLVYSRDPQHSANLIHRMALHATHGLGYEIPLRAGKPKDNSVWQRYLVEGLPGIGPSGARALLAHFKTPRAVFSAGADELRKVKGIGARTIEKILEVLG